MSHVIDHSPLTDCTSAAENESNIYNSALCNPGHKFILSNVSPLNMSVKALLQQGSKTSTDNSSNKAYVLSSHTPDATPVRMNCSDDENASPCVLPTTPVGSRRRMLDDVIETPTTTKHFVPCTPEKVYTPPPHGRHDPYCPCVFESTVSAEISFVACYSEASTPLKVSSVSNDAHTPARTHMYAKSDSVDVTMTTPSSKLSNSLQSARPPPLQSLQKLSSRSRCPQSPLCCTSMTSSPLSALKSTNPMCSSPAVTRPKSDPAYRSSGSQSQSRVVKTVVQCGIDRSSGRPVPKPKQDA